MESHAPATSAACTTASRQKATATYIRMPTAHCEYIQPHTGLRQRCSCRGPHQLDCSPHTKTSNRLSPAAHAVLITEAPLADQQHQWEHPNDRKWGACRGARVLPTFSQGTLDDATVCHSHTPLSEPALETTGGTALRSKISLPEVASTLFFFFWSPTPPCPKHRITAA